LLLAPIRGTGGDRDPTYDYLRDLDSEAEDMEASRLLYVAATRAKQRLHLLACLGCDDHGDPKKPIAHSLLSRAWIVAEPFFSEPQRPAPAREEPAAEAIYSINRFAREFRMPPLPDPARWTALPEGREEDEIEFSWAGETARHIGTVVHRWLQRMAQDELHGWDAKRIDSMIGAFRRELRRRGVAGKDFYSAAELVRTALKNTLADERGRWALGPHPEAQSEYRMRVRSSEGTRTYVLDRFFQTSDGERWTVDYKTSRHEGADLERFLDQELDRYSAQLKRYREAVRSSRLGLYFPLLRGWREG
jgi:ATP-dependent exoDNAse (exonuclease V) beta subunit